MSTVTYHVRKVSWGLRRKYRICADDGTGRPGELLGYAEKALTIADAVTVYRDGRKAETLVSVRESDQGWLSALTGYQAFGHDEVLLGSFGVLWRSSLERTTWHLEQVGLGRLTGRERSPSVARLRRLTGLLGVVGNVVAGLAKYHFDFTFDGAPAFSIEKPKVFDDWYRLIVRDERIDRRLLFALAVTMETRQRP